MSEKKEINLLDYIVVFVKNKRFLIGTTFISMVVFYLIIFFFVEEQFDASATIIPAQDNSLMGIAGAFGGLSDLPFNIGDFSSNPEVGLYNTILKSRSNAERIIEKYNLWDVYDFDKTVPKEVKYAREQFLSNLNGEETEDGAYVITMRTPDPTLSANITNDIVDYLNDKIIELKVKKSKENRIFLGDRVEEIREKLKIAEDSLKVFQKESGLLNPEEQIRGILTAYSQFEQELIIKQMQKEVLEEILDDSSPQLRNINLELEFFEEKIKEIQKEGKPNSIFVPYKSIPNKVVQYYRYYREVEINSSILQFILPLFEQAKLEEQKKIPVLQVIDGAKPPEEKEFPPRSIFTLLFGFSVFIILYMYILFKQNEKLSKSNQMEFIKKNLFKLKKN